MGSGKSGSQSKDYYGHMAWELCIGRLDFIEGLQLDNDLVWPRVKKWDAKIWKKGTYVINPGDGNVYKASDKTDIDPPTFPWVQVATPWVAGTYHAGDMKLYTGNVWNCVSTTNVAPPAISTPTQVEAQSDTITNGWVYVCTPAAWSGTATKFWAANSIVSWEGRVWTTAIDTATEPGAVGSDWTLFRVLRTDSPNPLKITVEDSGDWFLYWGLPDQVLDGMDETVLSSEGHPPYRNKAVLVAKNVKFGTMKTTPPNPVLLGGRAPVQTLIIDNTAIAGVNATVLDADWQANPWCVLAELLTHPVYGLGLPNTFFDAESWQAEADRCAANPQLFYISPVITDLKKVRDLVADLLSYPDAFVFWSTVATLVAGHWPHGEAAPAFDASNTINRNAIPEKEELNWSSGNWSETANSVEVSFRDWAGGFKSRSVSANSLFNMVVIGRIQAKKMDRQHIVRQGQALAWATEYAKIASEPQVKGEVKIQAEKATGVTPGKLFLLTDDVLQVSKVQRCTKMVISGPPEGTRKITHETERGVADQAYAPTPVNPTPAQGPSPSAILSSQIIQLPTSLAGASNRIACLAGRRDDVTTALSLWFQQADGAAYQDLGRQSAFAVGAAVLGNVNNGYEGYILTDNLVKGSMFNIPAGTIALDAVITYVPPGGGLTAGLAYTADYTIDLINGTITIPLGTSIPTGSMVIATLFDGAIATTNATPGNTYPVGRGFWTWSVWKRAAGAAYTGGFSGSTHLTEGADYTIDPDAGTITIINGGAVNATDVVFLFCAKSIALKLSPTSPTQDVENISSPPTEDEINDNSILLFLCQKADPTKYEIMSLQTFTAAAPIYLNTGTRNYNARVIRQQFGTLLGGDGSHVWNKDDIAFLIKKSDLATFEHESFKSLAGAEEAANFIIAPESAWVVADTSDIYNTASNPEGLSTEFSYTFANLFVPIVNWLQEQKNGVDVASWAGGFLTTDVFLLAFELDAPSGAQIINATLTAVLGQQQLTLWAQNFQPSESQNAAVEFSLPEGTWALFLNVLCDDGSAVSYPLTLVGNATPVTIHVDTPAVSYAWTPQIKSYTIGDGYVKNLYFGDAPAGASVYYQIQLKGIAYNPAGWSAALATVGTTRGPVPKFKRNTYTLYAYSSEAGKTDSPVASWNL